MVSDRFAVGRSTSSPKEVRRVAAGLGPLLVLYVLYISVRWRLAGRGPTLGARNAAKVLHLEERLDLSWETTLQGFLLAHEWLVRAANWYYAAGFLPVLILCGVIGAWRAPGAFRWWRRVFGVSVILALIGFAVFPLTPPRLLPPGDGFVDTLEAFGPRYYGDASGHSLFNLYGSAPTLLNEYAAMPSMHIAWSMIGMAMVVAAARRRWWSWGIAIGHVMAMALAVIGTGNHYVLDVLCGLAVLAVAVVVSHPRDLVNRDERASALR